MYQYGKEILNFMNKHKNLVCENGVLIKSKVSSVSDLITEVICNANITEKNDFIGLTVHSYNDKEHIKDLIILFSKIKNYVKTELCSSSLQTLDDMFEKQLDEPIECNTLRSYLTYHLTNDEKPIADFFIKYSNLVCDENGYVNKTKYKEILVNLRNSLCT